jgi:uncharacterized membrane protein
MKKLLSQFTWKRTCVLLLVLGIFFRFYNLDYKIYWYDETQTSLRISGYTRTQLVEQVFDGRVISVGDLQQQYQYPNDTRNLADTLDALAGSPEHTPGYFLLARFWLQTFGHSVLTIRLLSALISLLVFPCVYWLCQELFGSVRVSWAAVALLAISPFHVLYAQEARQYSLWTVTILFSSAALLSALRKKTIVPWSLYALSVALALYAHTFSGLVLIGHGIYVLLTANWQSLKQPFRLPKTLLAYLAASGAGLLLFAPWVWVVITHFNQFTRNTASVNFNRREFLPSIWALNLSRIFFDVNQGNSLLNPILWLTAALAIYALYFLYRNTPTKTWLFVITLVGVTGMALMLPDILVGGRRSSITRYVIPCFLGIQLAVAYLLTIKLNLPPSRSRRWWRTATIALILSGLVSCAVSSQMQLWWHKSFAKSRYNSQIARIVNGSDRPLVISDEIAGQILSLSHMLDPQVHLQLVVEPNIPKVATGFQNIYLYRPSENLRQGLAKQNLKLESAYKTWLWQVTLPN